MLRRTRRKANHALLSQSEFATFTQSMNELRDKVRSHKMLFLKHSGERWADMRTLPDDELDEFYVLTKRSFEAKRQAVEEAQRKRANAMRRGR